MHHKRLICFLLIMILTVSSLSPAMAEADSKQLCLLLQQDGDSSVFLAINPSAEPQTALLPDAARGFPRLAAYLSTAMNTEIPCDGSLLELPAWTIAICCA